MVTTILFDLDGTLLPMDQDQFVQAYLGGLAKKMIPHGYDPQLLIQCVWKGTGAMVVNDGSRRNDEVFWETFSRTYGKNCISDEAKFEEFYRIEFQEFRKLCGFNPKAKETVDHLKKMGFRIALATNPLFPAIATHSRTLWAGLAPEDFEIITTYENSYHCKPNLDYYRDIMGTLGVKPQECLMVGNDVNEDMIAQELGMQVFLLTDCIINKHNRDITQYPHGSFPELMNYIRSL